MLLTHDDSKDDEILSCQRRTRRFREIRAFINVLAFLGYSIIDEDPYDTHSDKDDQLRLVKASGHVEWPEEKEVKSKLE